MPLKALFYMGTGCSETSITKLINAFKSIFEDATTRIECWTKNKSLLGTINYLPENWNIIKGSWDLVVGHSAGGFPASLVNTKYKILVNPAFTQYKGDYTLFRATKDALVSKKRQEKANLINVVFYTGKHGTMPIAKFKDVIRREFSIDTGKRR